jgi:hypothetical protein
MLHHDSVESPEPEPPRAAYGTTELFSTGSGTTRRTVVSSKDYSNVGVGHLGQEVPSPSEIRGRWWVSAPEPGNKSRVSARSFLHGRDSPSPVIINHLGKLTLGAVASALGGLAYAQRQRISRWLDDCGLDTTPRAWGEAELDKLASLNANAVAEFKGLINDVHEELGSMTENFKELREEVASLKARQDAVEALFRSKSGEERVSNGKEEPASPPPRQMTGSTAASSGKRRGNGPVGPDSRPD